MILFVIFIIVFIINSIHSINDESKFDFVFVHVAKTGGTTANAVLPKWLNESYCEQQQITWGDYSHLLYLLGRTDRRCHFLSFEAHLGSWIEWADKQNVSMKKIRFLSFIRNPTSHWFSAYQHARLLYKMRHVFTMPENDRNRFDGAMPQHLKNISPHNHNNNNNNNNDNQNALLQLPNSFDEYVEMIANSSSVVYELKNFQMSFFGDTLAKALNNVKNTIYFIGLTEETRLSYALLHCMLFGSVDSVLLDELLSNRENDAAWLDQVTQNTHASCISNHNLKLLNEWNRDEIRFHSIVTNLFWRRVAQHRQCLTNANELDIDLLI